MSCGLSLVEVLVAVGICATVVLAAVALFGPAVRSTREVGDQRRAWRLVELVERELRRGGFHAARAATADGGVLQLVGSVDASQLVSRADADNDPVAVAPPGIPAERRYFAVAVGRAPSPASEPGCLVLEVVVTWPEGAGARGNGSRLRTVVALGR